MNSDPLLNTVIENRYTITARLARGGMASVYRAHDTRLDRDVAIKIIHSHLAEQPDFVDRFIREARSTARLSSRYVVNVYDQGVAETPMGDLPYLVMELISGPDLRSELNAHGSLPLGIALILVHQVLTALATAHSADIIHRDVKPENILLEEPLQTNNVMEQPDIHAHVADFGLARAASNSTQTATVLGTVAYVAPELVTVGTAGPTADVYATGIMLYELISGSLPFTGETPLAIAYQHVNNEVPQLHDIAPWIPTRIDSLIRLFTAKDPQKRPRDAQAAKDALEDVMHSLPPEILIRRIPVFPDNTTNSANATQALQTTQHITSDQPTNLAGTQKLEKLPTAQTKPLTKKAPPTSSKKQRHRRRRWPLVVLILTLLALAGGGTGWYFLLGPGLRVTVADISAMTLAEGQQALEKEGFTTEVAHDFSDTVPKDGIIRTDPKAGARIHPDNKVTIHVSDGIQYLDVPDLSSLDAEKAQAALKDAGFEKIEKTAEYSDTVEKNHVISQTPAAGNSVPHNSAISYVVSKGREPVKIPDLSKTARQDLEKTLGDLGLKLKIVEEHSDTIPEGSVISQSPAAQADGLRLDEVTVTVSLGPNLIEVPNVIGMQSGKATETLKNAGFNVEVKKILGGLFGTVRLQDPEGGSKIRPGSTITISIV